MDIIVGMHCIRVFSNAHALVKFSSHPRAFVGILGMSVAERMFVRLRVCVDALSIQTYLNLKCGAHTYPKA